MKSKFEIWGYVLMGMLLIATVQVFIGCSASTDSTSADSTAAGWSLEETESTMEEGDEDEKVASITIDICARDGEQEGEESGEVTAEVKHEDGSTYNVFVSARIDTTHCPGDGCNFVAYPCKLTEATVDDGI